MVYIVLFFFTPILLKMCFDTNFLLFQLFVVQLETEHVHGKLSLQKLWFYIQPTMLTMSMLSQITSTICKVSVILNQTIKLKQTHNRNITLMNFRQMLEVGKY